MKNTLKYIFIIAVLLSFKCQAQTVNFQGSWQDSTTTSLFAIDFKQQNTTITGTHYSVQIAGSKIDSSLDSSDITLNGNINSDSTIILSFKSSYGNGLGVAKITFLNPLQIKWEIQTPPSGTYYIPLTAILKRQ